MYMVKKEFDEIHKKVDKILELANNTNVRLSVLETKLNYTATAVDDQKKTMDKFVEDTVVQRRACATKFKDVDNSLSKAQGAVWMVGFIALIIGTITGFWAFVMGLFK